MTGTNQLPTMTKTTSKPDTLGNTDLEVALPENLKPVLTRTSKSLSDFEVGTSHYPEPIRTETRWLQGFFLDHCAGNAESLRAVACKTGNDKSKEYFYNILCGYNFKGGAGDWKHGGRAWSEFLELVSALRRHDQQIARLGQLPFIQTPTYHCIANFITAKRAVSAVCRIGGIIAPTGGQTSESFKFYRTLNNHGAVGHVEAPANGSLHALKSKILEIYHAKKSDIKIRKDGTLREEINETRTIIIDNAQVLYLAKHGNDQPAFNWIREIYDDKRPTIILKFTEEFLGDLERGNAKGYFEQFVGRMGGFNSLLRLPAHAPEADLRCIAHAFKLRGEGAYELLYKWSRQAGRIRIVFDKIQLAQTFAQEDKRDRIQLADLEEADAFVPPAIGSFDPNATEDAA